MIASAVRALLSREPFASTPLTVRDVVMLHCISSPGMTIFRKWNLGRDVIYILIGDRGSGKSVSGGTICMRDNLMIGEPVWSNLQVTAKLPVNDTLEQLLREYEAFTGQEIKRETVIYQSQELDAAKLLSSDPPYKGGMILVDEMNIELADSLRATMNQALATSDFVQLLRKMQSGVVGSCISEMFLPPRVREAVDIYIRTHDYAFINESDRYGQRQGMDYEWAVFPVTGKLAGYAHRYSETKEPWMKMRLHGKALWGIVDTLQRKERKKHVTHSLYESEAEAQEREARERDEAESPLADMDIEMLQSETVKADNEEWGWLYSHPFIHKMLETGAKIKANELINQLAEDVPLQLGKRDVLEHFEHFCNPDVGHSGSQKVYSFNALDRRNYLLGGRGQADRALVVA